MNENNNLNLNNEMQNGNKKNNNKVLYVIIGILVVAIIGCITIVINKSKEQKENKPEEEIVEKEENEKKVLCSDKMFDVNELSDNYKCDTYDPNYESSNEYNVKINNKKTMMVLSDKQNKEILNFKIKSEYDEVWKIYKLNNYYVNFVTNQYNDNYKGTSYTNYVVVGNSNKNIVTIDLEVAVKDNYKFDDEYDINKISSDGIYLELFDNNNGIWKSAIFRIPLKNNKLENKFEFVKYVDENSETKEFINPNSKYEYLVDRLHGAGCSYSKPYAEGFDISKLENSYILACAYDELNRTNSKMNDYKIPNTSEYYNIFSQYGNITFEGYSSKQLLEQAKEIFGKNTTIKNESIKFGETIERFYIKEIDAYINNDGIGCHSFEFNISQIISVNNKTNKLELVVAVASINEAEGTLNDNYGNLVIKTDNINEEEYIYNNANKFNQYKFTFTLEDGNYIFTGLEKLK